MLNREYWNEVKATANYVVALAVEALECDEKEIDEYNLREVINDHILHETVDNHEFIIYYHYHNDIMSFTDNEDYLLESIGEITGDSFSNILTSFAYWAFYADISGYLDDEISEYLEGLESE